MSGRVLTFLQQLWPVSELGTALWVFPEKEYPVYFPEKVCPVTAAKPKPSESERPLLEVLPATWVLWAPHAPGRLSTPEAVPCCSLRRPGSFPETALWPSPTSDRLMLASALLTRSGLGGTRALLYLRRLRFGQGYVRPAPKATPLSSLERGPSRRFWNVSQNPIT